jgi:hypothetical protein
MRHRPFVPIWILTLVVMCFLPLVAFGQDSGLTLALDKFGVGNMARRGDTAGIRLVVVDSAAANRSVLIRLSRTDPDGDTIESERVVTTNPGVRQGVWFYTRVPYDFLPRRQGTGIIATAYEANEVQNPAPGEPLFTPGRILAKLELDPKGAVQPRGVGLIGIVGTAHLGLAAYGTNAIGNLEPWIPGRGEPTEIVQNIQVLDMPDQWHGWAPFETLVWVRGEPSELKGERARAIREWVERGGHLVIVMPSVGQTWTNRQSNELFSILPTVSVQRKEGVELDQFRPMLVGRKAAVEILDPSGQPSTDQAAKADAAAGRDLLVGTGVVHTFTPAADAAIGDAMRVLNGPDGECVVARRLVGLGCVTLVGLDLGNSAIGSKVEAQAFWHRILGKRGRILTEADIKRLDAGGVNASPMYLDVGISGELNARQQGKSATGLFLGFVLFVVYWLVAGPVGFAILKQKKQTAHSWVVYFLSAVVFTAIAWAGATALRPKKIEVSHLTLFDHVYGQPTQRARVFASVLLPGYGDATVRVGEPDKAASATSTWDFIAPWETSDGDPIKASFPDARSYRVDARSPDSLRVPTRATVKEFVADWAGGTVWRMPAPDTMSDGSLSKIEWQEQGEGKPPIMTGLLKHELPGTLKDVRIIVVRGQDDFTAPGIAARDMWFNRAFALYYSEWPAGETLDLAKLSTVTSIISFMQGLVPALPQMTNMWGASQAEEVKPVSRIMSAMFTPLLPGPDINTFSTASVAVPLRSATHGWDIARWFTHPCLIIVAELEGETPVPLFVDGKPASSKGKTYVRWMYPLPDQPPKFQKP